MKITTLALGLLLVATPAFAADIDGKWTGSIDTPNGPLMVGYTFKAEGNILTGTADGPDGNPIAIADGKIDGNKISFSLTLDFGQGPTTFLYTGELAGTDLKLRTSFMDMPMDIAVKKT